MYVCKRGNGRWGLCEEVRCGVWGRMGYRVVCGREDGVSCGVWGKMGYCVVWEGRWGIVWCVGEDGVSCGVWGGRWDIVWCMGGRGDEMWFMLERDSVEERCSQTSGDVSRHSCGMGYVCICMYVYTCTHEVILVLGSIALCIVRKESGEVYLICRVRVLLFARNNLALYVKYIHTYVYFSAQYCMYYVICAFVCTYIRTCVGS